MLVGGLSISDDQYANARQESVHAALQSESACLFKNTKCDRPPLSFEASNAMLQGRVGRRRAERSSPLSGRDVPTCWCPPSIEGTSILLVLADSGLVVNLGILSRVIRNNE